MPVTKDGYFDFSDAPGDEGSLDDIFRTNNEPTSITAAPAATTDPTDANIDPELFLKTSTGTVYKTADEAVRGIEHKDATITQLRQQLLEATNVDPLKKKTETVADDPALVSYISNPKKYFEDIKKAQTEADVLKVQTGFVNEVLAPYRPIIATVVKSQAVDAVVAEVPTFRAFMVSDDYKSTLDSFPLLKNSIQIAESNPDMSSDLSQLYRMAFDASTGRNLPKAGQTSSHAQPVTARPTVSSTQTAPPPVSSQTAPPSFGNKEGRKTIIEQQEAAGVGNLRF